MSDPRPGDNFADYRDKGYTSDPYSGQIRRPDGSVATTWNGPAVNAGGTVRDGG